MRTRRQVISTAAALLAAVALVGAPHLVPASAPPPGGCPTGSGPGRTVVADDLTGRVPVAACGLDGAVVSTGHLAVVVPAEDGTAVTAAGTARTGHPAVLTVTRADGDITVRVWRLPAPPRPSHEPVSRMGRATPRPAADEPGDDGSARDHDAPGGDRSSGGDASSGGGESTAVEPTGGRCTDAAGAWLGMRWPAPYRWSFRPRGTPAYLGSTDQARDAVRAAARAVDEGHNGCGYGDGLALSQRYAGETERDAGIRADGTCGTRDERNVVAFGRLGGGLLALTCLWWSRGRTVEADVRISETPGMFLLEPTPDCTARWDLQGTLTHEFGHVFGLGHVSYAEHGDLTMSDGLPACSTRFRTLGLGDYLTLRAQYGTG